MAGSVRVTRYQFTAAGVSAGERVIPQETPVAIVHDAATYAVMMATPADLEDFVLGFSLTEGVIASLADVREIEIVEAGAGVEARLWLAPGRSAPLAERRRRLAGPTGCGLCGIESLEEAVRPLGLVTQAGPVVGYDEVMAAMAALAGAQTLGRETRAVHGAGFWRPAEGLVALREDVGRHNALDKLAGALARQGEAADNGIVLLTSRVSVEMVQKTAAMGVCVLVAVSAPTALAVHMAEEAGITLIAVARADGFEVFTHFNRVAGMMENGQQLLKGRSSHV